MLCIICLPTDDACSDDEEKDLISELKVLKHVGAHPNIVCLLGAAINNGKSCNVDWNPRTLLRYPSACGDT